MAVSAGFLEALRDALPFVPELRVKRMFGAAGVYSGEVMFGVIDDDTLYLKSDAETVADFDARGLRGFLIPDRQGRAVETSYRQAPDEIWDDPDEARQWVERAVAAALRKPAGRRSSRRTL